MFYVYAISSESRNYVYIGLTEDVIRRFGEHQSGKNKTTRPYGPFILIYSTSFENRLLARNHEKYLKGGSGRKYLRKIRGNFQSEES